MRLYAEFSPGGVVQDQTRAGHGWGGESPILVHVVILGRDHIKITAYGVRRGGDSSRYSSTEGVALDSTPSWEAWPRSGLAVCCGLVPGL